MGYFAKYIEIIGARKAGIQVIQVYTGNGKGKTTAALGLALRSAGAGLKVYIAQFLKGRHYSELNSLKKIKNIKVEQFGRRVFLKKNPTKMDVKMARSGLDKVRKIISSGVYDVVILDEINIALNLKLIEVRDILELLESASSKIELVLTGRYSPRAILKIADLVSDIKEVRHYYKKGIRARRGIEF